MQCDVQACKVLEVPLGRALYLIELQATLMVDPGSFASHCLPVVLIIDVQIPMAVLLLHILITASTAIMLAMMVMMVMMILSIPFLRTSASRR